MKNGTRVGPPSKCHSRIERTKPRHTPDGKGDQAPYLRMELERLAEAHATSAERARAEANRLLEEAVLHEWLGGSISGFINSLPASTTRPDKDDVGQRVTTAAARQFATPAIRDFDPPF